MKEIIYVLLDFFAGHEIPFLSQAITTDEMGLRATPKYVNKIAAASMEPVRSISGFRMVPDYTFDTMPDDYAALVLIGGYGWSGQTADMVKPIVTKAIGKGRPVGAICNAASWMAKHGFLNNISHTGNGLAQLKMWGGDKYTNAAGYVNQQAVCDNNIVTANGTGQLEFAQAMLTLLQNDTPEMIERYYQFYQKGLVELTSPKPRFHFNTIGLFTRDNAPMVTFYRDVFGFKTNWDGIQPNVEMTLGENRIILFPRTEMAKMTAQKYEYADRLNGTMEISIDVANFAQVDIEFRNAIAHGGKEVMAPTTEPWGQRTAYVADPDGNLVEISSFGNE